MANFDVVGKPCRRVDAYDKVTGKARYVGDIKRKGVLYGSILHSPIAHGIMTGIDTSKAKALEGVVSVVTYEDVPNIPYTSCGHPYPFDTPLDTLILEKHVRYVGDPIAAVAAVTPEIAEKAVSLITFTYDELPAVFTIEDAMKEGAPEIHEGTKNILGENEYEYGDVEKAFSEAAYVFEDVIETPIVTHCQIETHISLAEVDQATGRVFLHATTQVPTIMRERIAYALGRKMRDVRVIKENVGGGFGGKQEPVYEIINCLLAIKTNQPVLLDISREECLAMTRCRHASKVYLRTALDKDYKFTARVITAYNNNGAYSSHGHNVMYNIASEFRALYPTPSMHFIGKSIYTNLLIAGAMRGYGIPQETFVMESHIDNIARALHIDPYELRQRNIYHPGGPFYGEDITVGSCGLQEMMEKGRKAIGWDDFQNTTSADGKIKRGIGMACCSYLQCCYPFNTEWSSARVQVHEDGSASLYYGCTEIGQGTDTIMPQIAAEALGVPFEWVHSVLPVDTDISPFDPGAYASRQTYVSGYAVKKAALACKEDILVFAAKKLEKEKDSLDVKKGYLVSKDTGEQICPLEDITRKMYYNTRNTQSICHEVYHCPTDNALTFGTVFAIVSVDTATGKVTVEKLLTYLDSGVVINPITSAGQLYGGAVMSMGYGLMEQVLINPKTGQVYNDNLLDYKIPTMADYPNVEGHFVETDEPSSAYGNKSMGEPPNLAPAAAIRNAVVNATGVTMNRLPLTPERVWEFLHPDDKEDTNV